MFRLNEEVVVEEFADVDVGKGCWTETGDDSHSVFQSLCEGFCGWISDTDVHFVVLIRHYMVRWFGFDLLDFFIIDIDLTATCLLMLLFKWLSWNHKIYVVLAWPFFTQISGRNFLPELCGEVFPKAAPLQAPCCAPCSTEQSTFQGGRKVREGAERRGGRGVASKGGKKEKGRVKTGNCNYCFRTWDV